MTNEAAIFDYESVTVPACALFVAADEPLQIYPSAQAAERALEPIDVENGVYSAAYGPKGEPYRIESDGKRVFIERTDEAARPEQLKALILRYLEAIGQPVSEAASLDSLVQGVWQRESEFWREHDPYGDRFASRAPLWSCMLPILLLTGACYLVFRWVW